MPTSSDRISFIGKSLYLHYESTASAVWIR